MKPNDFSKTNISDTPPEANDAEMHRMNESYMNDFESRRQFKINQWLWVAIVVLSVIIAVQSYLLWKPLQQQSKGDSSSLGLKMDDLFKQKDPIGQWDAFDEFQKMQKRMDDFFKESTSQWETHEPPMKSFSFGGPFSQQYDLKETDDQVIVSLNLPGLNETNIDVTVQEGTLKISGTLREEKKRSKDNSTFQSKRSSHFERYLTLPQPVKENSLKVDYEDNTLTVQLDKK